MLYEILKFLVISKEKQMIETNILVKMTIEYDGKYRDIADVISDVRKTCIQKTIGGSDEEIRITKMEVH